MTPDKKTKINGHIVEEFYWAGDLVTYVNNWRSRFNYEKTCEILRNGKSPEVVHVSLRK